MALSGVLVMILVPNNDARRGQKKGGRTGGRGRPKDRLELVHKVADTMIHKLLQDEIAVPVAAVIIQAGHLKLRACLADLKVQEQTVLVERMEEIEEALAYQRSAYGA